MLYLRNYSRLVLVLLLILIPSIALSYIIQGRRNGDAVPADFETDLEGSVACSSVFSGTTGTPDCDDTSYPISGTDDLLIDNGVTEGVYWNFGSAQTEVWFSVYFKTTDSNINGQPRYVLITSTSDSIQVQFNARDNSGDRWTVRDFAATYYDAASTHSPDAGWYLRGYAKKDDTVGRIQLWTSANGSSYNLVCDSGDIDSSSAADWDRIWISRPDAATVDGPYYFDDFKVYLSDPGW